MLSRSLLGPASALLASFLAFPVAAQLTTDCNPLYENNCTADVAFGADYTFYFNSTPDSSLWSSSAGTIEYSSENGAAFTIAEEGYSPTLTSQFFFFWGRTEVIMKTANGTGIISSIVYGSDDLDEVDWEFLGGDTLGVQTNYYGKGVTTDYTHGASFNATSNIQSEWHNYTNVWTEEKLEWWLDGTLLRTLYPADANDTWAYPQTPMSLRLGIWAGGDSSQAQGTIEWAGGATDYSTGPFTMYVQSVRVTDYSKGSTYEYTDNSGNYTSIKINDEGANSTAYDAVFNKKSSSSSDATSISEKWAALSSTTKIAIYALIGGVVLVSTGLFALYYFKQRSQGRREAAELAEAQEQERVEMERFKKEGRSPDDLGYSGTEYNPKAFGAPSNVVTSAGGLLGPSAAGYTALEGGRSNSLHSTQDMPESTSAWDPMSNSNDTPGSPQTPTASHPPGSSLRNPSGYGRL